MLIGHRQADPCGNVPVADCHLAADLGRRTDHGDHVQHLVIDAGGDLVPAPLLGQPVQFGLDLAPAVHLEGGPVGGGRTVERQVHPDAPEGPFPFLLVAVGAGEHRGDHHHVVPGSPHGLDSVLEAGNRHFLEEPAGVERMDEDAVGHLAGETCHLRTEGTQPDRWWIPGMRLGDEHRCHQRERVVLAPVVELLSRLPAVVDGTNRLDGLAHLPDRTVPAGREALLDVGADLAAQPERRTTLGQPLQVVAEVGEVHRTTRERQRHIRIAEKVRVFGHQRQGQEDVAAGLEGEDTVDAGRLEGSCPVRDIGQMAMDAEVDLHRFPDAPEMTITARNAGAWRSVFRRGVGRSPRAARHQRARSVDCEELAGIPVGEGRNVGLEVGEAALPGEG